MNEKIIIRPVKITDAPEIHNIRIMPEVYENTMSLPSETLGNIEEFLRTNKDPVLVAEVDGHVVGMAGLYIYKPERMKHRARLGIMIHKDFQGHGIGKALMQEIINIADKWLMLKRIDLEVFTDNERAVNLYKSAGFVVEGTAKYAGVRNGMYQDFYTMARYNL